MTMRFPLRLAAGLLGVPGAMAGPPAGIPADARYCALQVPPPEAGAWVTPGGFLLAFPRNGDVARDYTGCRTLWVVRGTGETPLLMRLYFHGGRLAIVQAHDGRGGPEIRLCGLPSSDPACAGLADNPLLALDLPTWPRACVEQPDLAACAGDPE